MKPPPSQIEKNSRGVVRYGNHAGYVVWDPEATLSELKYLGEEWALPEYKVTPHLHPNHELHLQISGGSEWDVNGEKVVLSPNMLIVVAPNQRHTMRSIGSQSQYFIYAAIDIPSCFNRCGLPMDRSFIEKPFVVMKDAEHFKAPLCSLTHEVGQERPHRSTLFQYAFNSLVYLLARVMESADHENSYPSTMDKSLVYRVKSYMDRHLSSKVSIDELVKAVGVSRSVLFEAMKREVGMTPLAYHAVRRIELAKSMLRIESLPITTIALDLGYGSSQHFSSAFRKLEGISPSSYRQWHRTAHGKKVTS